MSKTTQTSHPQSSQKSIGLPIDECICSAKCKNVHKNGEPVHEVFAGLRVGNYKDRSVFGVGYTSPGLAIYECICSIRCVENCRDRSRQNEVEIGIKYCPDLDIILPVYNHIEYTPRYSAKQNHIFKLDTQTDTHIFGTGWYW